MSAAGGDRQGEDIQIATDAGVLRAYRAVPASERGPGVIVVQEWWGLVDHIRDICDRLAREGFVALAPDLYRGEATGDPDVAGRLMMDLEIPRAAVDLDEAVKALLDHHAVEGSRVGAIGFCMGGQLALFSATRNERVGAVVDCYGIHPNVQIDASRIRAAILGVFAEHDEFVPAAAVAKLESELAGAGVRVHFKTYPGVQHAFLNDTRPDVYDASAAAVAWGDILTFLRAELA